MSKTTIASLATRIDDLQQTVDGLTDLLADARKQLAAAAEREQTTALVIADLRHQLKLAGDQRRQQPAAEDPPASDQAATWWGKRGLKLVDAPAQADARWVRDFGFSHKPYAWILRTKDNV